MLRRLLENIKNTKNDILLILGLAVICYGLWLIYQPLAYLMGGIGLIFLSLLDAYANRSAS